MRFTQRARRVLVSAAAGAMVLGLLPVGAASADAHQVCENPPSAPLTDKGTTHAANIDCMAALDVGDFGTDFDGQAIFLGRAGSADAFGDLTRGQAASLLVKFALVATDGGVLELLNGEGPEFTDVEGTVHAPAIGILAELGLIEGYGDGTFGPSDDVERAQFAQILYNAHVALGVDFDDVTPVEFPDVDRESVSLLAGAGVIDGRADGTFDPWANVGRGATASMLAASAEVLASQDLWNGPTFPAETPIGPNETFTDAPELVEVIKGSSDIVQFVFDEPVEGKALDFDPAGNAGDGAYTGLRLYNAAGDVSYPTEANIDGNVVTARYTTTVVANAVRAGVYTFAVQDATGIFGIAGDFPLRATAVTGIPAYFPQLISVGNYDLGDVASPDTNQEVDIAVDFTLQFRNETQATAVATAVSDAVTATPTLTTDLAPGFSLTLSEGEIFRADNIDDFSRSGSTITFTVIFEETVSNLPETEIRRGVIIEDNFAPLLAHTLLSTAWEGQDAPNGTTGDPDLIDVQRAGVNTMRFVFDQPVSAADIDQSLAELYAVTDSAENRARATAIGRSAIAGDEARVVIATFSDDAGSLNFTIGDGATDAYPSIGAYLDNVTAAFVDANWDDDPANTEVDDSAARASQQTQSQQGGWSTPAGIIITPPDPTVEDLTPGVTARPDLVSMEKQQNAVTGNWRVIVTFDEEVENAADVVVTLYNSAGVRLPQDGVLLSAFADSEDGTVWTINAGLAGSFTNAQVNAAVVGSVVDGTADLSAEATEVEVTEGSTGLTVGEF